MLRNVKLQLLWATVLSFTVVNSVNIHLPIGNQETGLKIGNEAHARSSGGRSGGGSFRSSPSRSSSSPSRSSSGSSSSPRNSTPSQSSRGSTGGRAGGGSFQRTIPLPSSIRTQPTRPNSSWNDPYYRQPGSTVIVPVPVAPPPVYTYPNSVPANQSTYPQTLPGASNSVPAQVPTNSGYSSNASNSSSDFPWLFLLMLLAVGSIGLWAYFIFLKKKGGSAAQELENDTVTVSKIQVALLAQARSIQSHLTELSLNVDTDTSEGLMQLLQESALALLRSPENWTHVLASSQTVKSREDAEAIFNQVSIQERSKFSAETLTNVGGRVRQQKPVMPSLDDDPAAYIVVTLLVGTADDKPLFEEIRTAEALKSALEKVASISPDYLMVFELLWSPQAETDSLTYDELLTEYTDMVQI
ncbi:DUF1517 domain-containing protein [Coleofasciculus sp. FACHB-1120]|uniref:DUF1517 domain-containing protein n=1 Tax=Coleofasciculus sp. FACHB-1120 TaxID=2692783 RepID=UPI001682138B|nr:DUF1517 domain-containing protein [Coleofasciculus sp. FACHB-1120]MBD2741655.1 DUF1517 domain-containing protein [Coleofasciculus sp. FACHB-1120]